MSGEEWSTVPEKFLQLLLFLLGQIAGSNQFCTILDHSSIKRRNRDLTFDLYLDLENAPKIVKIDPCAICDFSEPGILHTIRHSYDDRASPVVSGKICQISIMTSQDDVISDQSWPKWAKIAKNSQLWPQFSPRRRILHKLSLGLVNTMWVRATSWYGLFRQGDFGTVLFTMYVFTKWRITPTPGVIFCWQWW